MGDIMSKIKELSKKIVDYSISVNENDKELAANCIRSLGKDVEKQVEFLMNKAYNDFF